MCSVMFSNTMSIACKSTLFRPSPRFKLHCLQVVQSNQSQQLLINLRLFSGLAYNGAVRQQCKSARLRQIKSPHPVSSYVKNRSYQTGIQKGVGPDLDQDIIFRQLLEYKSYTYTYILADASSKEAVLIDPVLETVERDLKVIYELGLKLVYAVNTHVHADHVTGSGQIKRYIPTCMSIISEAGKAKADIKLKDGDLIDVGKFKIEARSTPGHTDGCMSYVWHEKDMVFTGDALLIRGCGRTDFQQGCASRLYDSVHNKILSLPRHFRIFPGHDYTGQTMSTVGEELRFNPRLNRPKEEFAEIMSKLNLPYPHQMEKALPLNLMCGVFEVPDGATS